MIKHRLHAGFYVGIHTDMYLHTQHSNLHATDIKDFVDNKMNGCYFICQQVEISICRLLTRACIELKISDYFSFQKLFEEIQ